MAFQNVKDRYVSDGAGTVSQARLLILLYDRLVLDIEHANAALNNKQFETVNDKLCHAQAIVIELRSALDHDAWDGAANLDSIYIWLDSELMRSNVKKDGKGILGCSRIAKELQDAWHQAYERHLQDQAAATPNGAK